MHPILERIWVIIKRIAVFLFYLFIAAFIYEFVAKLTKTVQRPSLWLTELAAILRQFFESIGRCWAIISSYLTYIEFEQVWETFIDLLTPLVEIVFSGFYIIKGYFNTAETYKNPTLIVIGSLALLAIISWLCYRYRAQLATIYERIKARYVRPDAPAASSARPSSPVRRH